jgi:hypothetical protein
VNYGDERKVRKERVVISVLEHNVTKGKSTSKELLRSQEYFSCGDSEPSYLYWTHLHQGTYHRITLRKTPLGYHATSFRKPVEHLSQGEGH